MTDMIRLPYMLDFYPLEDEKSTRIHKFFISLKEGRLTTTRCKKCEKDAWQPRAVCPECGSEDLVWIDLPTTGILYAFTSMVLGPPLGMENDVPFVIGLVQLDDSDFRILSRIESAKYEDCSIGMKVRMKVVHLDDGRVWFRFEPIS